MQEKKNTVRMTVAHSRAARGLLGWTVEELAARAGLSADTIVRWENGRNVPRETTRETIKNTYESAGVVFTNGDNPGVSMRIREGN